MAARGIFQLSRQPELWAPTLELIERVFPAGEAVVRKTSLENEFALLLSPRNRSQSWVMTEGREVVAHVAYRLFEFQMDDFSEPLTVAGIGLVVTDAARQKTGLASALLAHVEKMAAAEGALLSVLWTGQHDFFDKQGYLLAGTEEQWELAPAKLAALKSPSKPYTIQ